MRKYWNCKTAKDAVAKVVVRNNPKWYNWSGLDYFFGDKKESIQQFNRWYMCDSHSYGMWDSVELYFKVNGNWVKQDSNKYWFQDKYWKETNQAFKHLDWDKIKLDIN